ncbi:RhsD protein [Candidatus Moduliflexus flocculans]|uniref:RhsD protein n=1 Tax=Candidatus Moduliflexus flocculans TaxID=1499966 RepID=A0A0S6VS93_9BACT|nr:RhsD protein [Candidatus Moduliflexus flocculans]
MTRDPLGEAGGLNLYAFVGNNPVNWGDPWGLKPGDLFNTIEDAAIDASNYIYPNSIQNKSEYGGWIWKRTGGLPWKRTVQYGYDDPVTQKNHRHVEITIRTCEGERPEKTPVAIFHSHAIDNPRYDGENFSLEDRSIAERKSIERIFPIFVITPLGVIKKYDPINGISIIGQYSGAFIGFPY